MKKFYYAIIATLTLGSLIAACEEETQQFACNVVEMEATEVTQTSATLTATVNATDYAAIDRMGFGIRSDKEAEFEFSAGNISRIITLNVSD